MTDRYFKRLWARKCIGYILDREAVGINQDFDGECDVSDLINKTTGYVEAWGVDVMNTMEANQE